MEKKMNKLLECPKCGCTSFIVSNENEEELQISTNEDGDTNVVSQKILESHEISGTFCSNCSTQYNSDTIWEYGKLEEI